MRIWGVLSAAVVLLCLCVVSGSAATIARAGGPYSITLGEDLVLDASASLETTASATITSYKWDINYSGGPVSFDVDTSNPIYIVSASALSALGMGVGSYNMYLVATSDANSADSDFASLEIVAAVPVPASFPLALAGLGGLAMLCRRRKCH
nr:VPLPA-CTERM sorting domain-containing protein [uncultured Roseibium sp.]